MPEFNGHKNWNHWNVSLWLNNDETSYRKMVSLCQHHKRKKAAEKLQEWLGGQTATTPDGGQYSISAIMGAMRGL